MEKIARTGLNNRHRFARALYVSVELFRAQSPIGTILGMAHIGQVLKQIWVDGTNIGQDKT